MRFSFFTFYTTAATLGLGLLCPAQATANPVPADDQSLTSGAALYERHCTACHGWGAAVQFNAIYAAGGSIELPDPIDPFVPIDPGNAADEADPTDLTDMSDVIGVIDDIYAADAEPSYGGSNNAGRFEDSDRAPGATDLTDPEAYYNGTSEEDIFNSIANGAGVAMPAWRSRLGSDEAVWDLVNFIRSLWGARGEWEY